MVAKLPNPNISFDVQAFDNVAHGNEARAVIGKFQGKEMPRKFAGGHIQ